MVFVPSTNGGLLVRKLSEREEDMTALTGFKIKYQEAEGKKLINSFENDLGQGRLCGRTPCPPCDSNERKQDCRSKNVLYGSVLRICNPVSSQKEGKDLEGYKPMVGVYIGETSRTIHERSMEHVSDARTFSSKSYIVKHWMSVHPELNTPWPWYSKSRPCSMTASHTMWLKP